MKNQRVVMWGMFIFALGVAGCARRVMTDTYLGTQNGQMLESGSSYAVLANENVENPIFDQTVKAKIETLLAAKDFRLVPVEQADYLIQYTYNIEGHEETRWRGYPNTGFHFFGGHHHHPHFGTHLGYSTVIGETWPVYISRARLRVLEAAPFRDENRQSVVWVGEAWTESRTRDLREMIDYLLTANFVFFGQDTERSRNVGMDDDHPLIQRLESQALQPSAASHKTA